MLIDCGTIRDSHIGKDIEIYGWCRYKRDHGVKLFVDLADRYGTTQLVFDGENAKKAQQIGREYVIHLHGRVKKREDDTLDASSPTGSVEVIVSNFDVISKSEIPPFEIIEEKKKFLANEEIRMKYRYLDLRRKEMLDNIIFRDNVTKNIRKFFWQEGFLELETPMLVKDTYETGSRTFLVPSRTIPGKFYALPQSPQVYKQLCMMSGLDKYFQIARCFRDEDPREDRQPEFTQIDIEIAFKDEKYIEDLIERMVKGVFEEMLGKHVDLGFRHMSYADAMSNYGSDKPDLRFESTIKDITQEVSNCDYNILKQVISRSGKVKAAAFDADFELEQTSIDKNYMLRLIEFAKGLGLKGLTWAFVKNNKLSSYPTAIAQSLGSASESIIEKLKAKENNIIIICADLSEKLLLEAMGKIRKKLGDDIGRYNSEFEFLWVDEFPLFEKDDITSKLRPAHNPFCAPTDSTIKFIETEPEKVMSRQYDLVINGVEIGSGSIRINDPQLQIRMLKLMGMDEKTINDTFGFLIDALRYGAPIEGGMAPGLDRLVAVMKHSHNMRDFILFPKNKRFEALIDESPTEIDEKRLKKDYKLKRDYS